MMKPLLAFKCLAASGLILAAAGLSSPRLASLSVDRNFCEEVAHELNLAYLDGRIQEGDAKSIIDRCFELYS